MNEILVIKNGLVLTLDSKNNSGYFTIVVKNGIIHRVDYTNELDEEIILRKYPGADVYDASHKIILPSFINIYLNSGQSLNSFFLKDCNYENINSSISLNLVEKYFSHKNNADDLYNLFYNNYLKSFFYGETTVVELSSLSTRGLAEKIQGEKFFREIIYTAYESSMIDFLNELQKPYFISIKKEEEFDNYYLNFLKRGYLPGKNKIFLDILHCQKTYEKINELFGKSLIKILEENNSLNMDLILSNPICLNEDELKIIEEKRVNIVFCPGDYLKLSKKFYIDFSELSKKVSNPAIGTGISGKSVFEELKCFYKISYNNSIPCDIIIKMATLYPAEILGFSNILGSIEKNRYADLIMFDISGIRNFLTVPEINSEIISWFILENLNSSDISDIIVNGRFFKKNFKTDKYDKEKIRKIHINLCTKVFDEGKYLDLKEKQLMKIRVRDLTVKHTPETDSPDEIRIYDNMEELISESNLDSDSDFRILGAQKSELLERELEFSTMNDVSNNSVKKINSLDNGFNFFDDDSSSIENSAREDKSDNLVTDDRDKYKTVFKKKIKFDDFENYEISEDINETNDPPSDIKYNDKKDNEERSGKPKLRFGFDNED